MHYTTATLKMTVLFMDQEMKAEFIQSLKGQ